VFFLSDTSGLSGDAELGARCACYFAENAPEGEAIRRDPEHHELGPRALSSGAARFNIIITIASILSRESLADRSLEDKAAVFGEWITRV
jgi:hypothetical protein